MTDARGLTILEILIAVSIMALAVIPLYTHLSGQASTAFETEKIQMADKILQSVKEELTALPFSEFYKRTKDQPADKEGPFELSDGYYPVTLDQVLKIQKQHKDFQVTGVWKYLKRGDKIDKTMIQVDMKINWNVPGKNWERTRSFLLVAPK